MSDEKIDLPGFLIAELFKRTLVEPDIFKSVLQGATPEEEPAKTGNMGIFSKEPKFLGENGKGIIILVNEPEVEFLLESNFAFLTNILKACKLDLKDIAIINTSKEEIDYETIKKQLKAEIIFLFDVEPASIKLPFIIPAFQIQKYAECTIMVAPPLHLLNKADDNGKLLKTRLWMSLKKVFNV